jgi:hypothetical protein
MKMLAGTYLPLGLLCGLLAGEAALPASAQEKARQDDGAAREDDLVRVQGKWERTMKDEDGRMLRIVKEHKGNQTTVTAFDESGQVVRAHTSLFRLQRREGVRIFTFSNMKVTEGPNKGAESREERSYIYKVEADTFAEVQGFLIGDPSPTNLILWKRPKP